MFSTSAVVLDRSNVCYSKRCLAFFIDSLEIVVLGFDFTSPELLGLIPRYTMFWNAFYLSAERYYVSSFLYFSVSFCVKVAIRTSLNLSFSSKVCPYSWDSISDISTFSFAVSPEASSPVAKVYSSSPTFLRPFFSNTDQQSSMSFMCMLYFSSNSWYYGKLRTISDIFLKSKSSNTPILNLAVWFESTNLLNS